jgi:hypothetical protein
MKKLLTIFLILLTFSNTALAGFFGFFKDVADLMFDPAKSKISDKNVRCKVEYTQLDLSTGLEKNVKHTAQYETKYIAHGNNLMYLSAQDLTKKINKWLNESPNNIVADMTGINCKEGDLVFSIYYIFHPQMSWDKYKSCEDKYNVDLINLLERPKQWGYNVHKERLIKDYEEGCKNYIGEGY